MGLFMAISVGPTLFAVIRYSLSYSYRAGLAFVLGVSVSDLLYVSFANFAAHWLKSLESYQQHIAYGGAVALMAIGVSGLIRKHKPKRQSASPLPVSGGHYFRIWAGGFLVNTLNPGVLITWLGAVTIISNSSGLYRFILFGTCLTIILGIDFLKVFLAERIKKMLTPRRIIIVQRFSAACILLIGLLLFISTMVRGQSTQNQESNGINKILTQ